MEPSPVSQWLGITFEVTLKEPLGDVVIGKVANVVPDQLLTLEAATVVSTGQWFARLNIHPHNIFDITHRGPSHSIDSRSASAATPSIATPVAPAPPEKQHHNHAAFQDPAIVSMSRKPPARASTLSNHTEKEVVFSPHKETQTFQPPDLAKLTLNTDRNMSRPTTVPGIGTINDDDDDAQDLTPVAATARPEAGLGSRKRGKRSKKNIRPADEANSASSARPTDQTKGWRETPMLQSTKSFQPFTSLKRSRKSRVEPGADNGWASEDVTDVQEAGDFDFEGSLAKFDKRTIFDEMRQRDDIDEADRLVSHNRIPRPKPGTAGGKNFHYTENVLDATPSASKVNSKETAVDFWRSETDDDPIPVPSGTRSPTSHENSGRNSRLRGDSRMSTSRHSQPRKTSTSGVAGPSRVNSGPSPAASALPGLYSVLPARRIDTVTHLQMAVVENVATSELGMTEDLIAENAGRGICEVAMRALKDPALQLRAAALPPPAANTIVVVAGNNKSGARSIAAARHLRNRNINVLVCVVGIERERDLSDDVKRQIRLFRTFGGTVYKKSDLFSYLAQLAANSLSSLDASGQAPISLIIDALLGLTVSFEELRSSDQATTYELMEWANRNEAFVMAVDIPSGIEPSTGKVNVIDGSQLYIQPRYVVALGAPKAGLLKALESVDEDEYGDDEGGGLHDNGNGANRAAGLGIVSPDEWKVYLADIGLGQAAWKKGARIRKGIDCWDGADSWVMQLRYYRPGDD
ncbi:YjeF-related protein N-terminus-domain-containing protein [Astrocystis sublimbata]|nr:YjeF-related protein N-terminus-domain-containing protein [Astrocystis sublimbata]